MEERKKPDALRSEKTKEEKYVDNSVPPELPPDIEEGDEDHDDEELADRHEKDRRDNSSRH
jgi:hypothetical protein